MKYLSVQRVTFSDLGQQTRFPSYACTQYPVKQMIQLLKEEEKAKKKERKKLNK